jgi:hypothetical protein
LYLYVVSRSLTPHWYFNSFHSFLIAQLEHPMFRSLALLSLLVSSYHGAMAIPFARSASNVNLAIARSINITGFPNIVAADQARAKVLREMGLASGATDGGALLKARGESSFPVTNAVVCMGRLLSNNIDQCKCHADNV